VVDDEAAVRDTLGRFLRSLGYQVSFASDGLQGLESARAALPDLMVLDVDMPRMSGLDLCAVLKADAATRSVPILFLTASDSMGTAEDALAKGADGYLAKPLDFSRFKAKLESLLGKAG
jgi:CheY-like chemotaxis protein